MEAGVSAGGVGETAVGACGCRSCESAAYVCAGGGTQFICFTSTKVQILTGEEQLDEKMGRLPALTSLNLSNNAIKVLSLLALLV